MVDSKQNSKCTIMPTSSRHVVICWPRKRRTVQFCSALLREISHGVELKLATKRTVTGTACTRIAFEARQAWSVDGRVSGDIGGFHKALPRSKSFAAWSKVLVAESWLFAT